MASFSGHVSCEEQAESKRSDHGSPQGSSVRDLDAPKDCQRPLPHDGTQDLEKEREHGDSDAGESTNERSAKSSDDNEYWSESPSSSSWEEGDGSETSGNNSEEEDAACSPRSESEWQYPDDSKPLIPQIFPVSSAAMENSRTQPETGLPDEAGHAILPEHPLPGSTAVEPAWGGADIDEEVMAGPWTPPASPYLAHGIKHVIYPQSCLMGAAPPCQHSSRQGSASASPGPAATPDHLEIFDAAACFHRVHEGLPATSEGSEAGHSSRPTSEINDRGRATRDMARDGEWYVEGSPYLGQRILRATFGEDGECLGSERGTVVGWLPEEEAEFVSEHTKQAAALWHVRYDAAYMGEEDLEEFEVLDGINDLVSYGEDDGQPTGGRRFKQPDPDEREAGHQQPMRHLVQSRGTCEEEEEENNGIMCSGFGWGVEGVDWWDEYDDDDVDAEAGGRSGERFRVEGGKEVVGVSGALPGWFQNHHHQELRQASLSEEEQDERGVAGVGSHEHFSSSHRRPHSLANGNPMTKKKQRQLSSKLHHDGNGGVVASPPKNGRRACLLCGQVGHYQKKCPNRSAVEARKAVSAFNHAGEDQGQLRTEEVSGGSDAIRRTNHSGASMAHARRAKKRGLEETIALQEEEEEPRLKSSKQPEGDTALNRKRVWFVVVVEEEWREQRGFRLFEIAAVSSSTTARAREWYSSVDIPDSVIGRQKFLPCSTTWRPLSLRGRGWVQVSVSSGVSTPVHRNRPVRYSQIVREQAMVSAAYEVLGRGQGGEPEDLQALLREEGASEEESAGPGGRDRAMPSAGGQKAGRGKVLCTVEDDERGRPGRAGRKRRWEAET